MHTAWEGLHTQYLRLIFYHRDRTKILRFHKLTQFHLKNNLPFSPTAPPEKNEPNATIPDLNILLCLVRMSCRTHTDSRQCQGTLLTKIQLAIKQNPQMPFHRRKPPSSSLSSQFVHTARLVPSQVQVHILVLVKLHAVGDCPALQFVKTFLCGLSTLK